VIRKVVSPGERYTDLLPESEGRSDPSLPSELEEDIKATKPTAEGAKLTVSECPKRDIDSGFVCCVTKPHRKVVNVAASKKSFEAAERVRNGRPDDAKKRAISKIGGQPAPASRYPAC
jgi:hypothetical protein